MLLNESLKLGQKVLVIRLCQLPADVNDEQLSAVLFIELNGHFGSFLPRLGPEGFWKIMDNRCRKGLIHGCEVLKLGALHFCLRRIGGSFRR